MSKPLIATKSVSALEAHSARLSIVSGALFILLLLSLHFLEPEYDPTWRFISEYALGRFGWLMTLAFIALAGSLAGCFASLLSQTRTGAGYIGLGLLGIAVLGILLAAAFPTDSMSGSNESMTFSGKMHVLGASLDWTPVAALLLSFSLTRNQAWWPVRKRLFITAGITIVAMFAFMAALPADGQFGPGVMAGLVGRFSIVSHVGWLLAVGFHALQLHKQSTTR